MSKSQVNKPTPEGSVAWREAIEDAQVEIRRMERRIAGLKASIVVFRERMEAGAPFPGEAQR